MKDAAPDDPKPPPLPPITAEQRRAWIESSIANDPPLTPAFLQQFADKARLIITTTAREYHEVCRRSESGEFKIPNTEVGFLVAHGKRNRRTSYGWTFHLYHPPPRQTNLL